MVTMQEVVTSCVTEMQSTTKAAAAIGRWASRGTLRRWMATKTEKPTSTHVSVIGLHWKTDEARLRNAFSGYGTLEKAELITPAHSESHLWARLVYSTFDEALEAVIEMNGQELDGRLLRVSIADPPKEDAENK